MGATFSFLTTEKKMTISAAFALFHIGHTNGVMMKRRLSVIRGHSDMMSSLKGGEGYKSRDAT